MKFGFWTYLRIASGIVFLWVFALGFKSSAWHMVALPLLAMAAALIWAEKLRREYPEIASKLILGATVFMGIYAVFLNAPPVYETIAGMIRDGELTFQRTHNPPLLEVRAALLKYLQESGNVDGKKLVQELNDLTSKRRTGTFGADDLKREDELFKKAAGLSKRDAQLSNLLNQIWRGEARDNEQAPFAAPSPKPQEVPYTSSAPRGISTSSNGRMTPARSSRQSDKTEPKPGTSTSPVLLPLSDNEQVSSSSPSHQVPRLVASSQSISTPLSPSALTPTLPSGGEDEYSLIIEQCSRTGEILKCWGYATNRTDAPTMLVLRDSNSVDDEGNSFVVTNYGGGFTFANGDHETLIPNVPTRFFIKIRDPHSKVRYLNFHLTVYWKFRFGNMIFKNVPVQGAE